MRTLQIPTAVAVFVFYAFAAANPTPAATPCGKPQSLGYQVDYPQGEAAPVKLYESNKGGRVGTVPAAQIAGKLQLCAETVGNVNLVRLPKGAAIKLEAGKTGADDRRYWVRSNQVRFESLTAQKNRDFDCERNQVKTRVAGGAAGGEECKKK